jgi:hypothetical protein
MSGHKSLADLYSEIHQQPVRLEVMPVQTHRTDDKLLQEAYMLSILDQDTNNIIYTAELNEEELGPVTRSLDSNQKITIGKSKYTVPEIIDKCLEIDKWKTGNSKYEPEILDPIVKAFNSVDLNRELFGNLIDIQTDPNNPIRTLLLAQPGQVFNYFEDLIPDKVYALFATKQDAINVINQIWMRDTKIGVSVGKGEIAIAFFSDGFKGAKGDLQYNGLGEVELKGTGARMGSSDGYALIRTPENLNKILQDREIAISDWQLEQIKETIISSIREVVTKTAKDDVRTYAAELEALASNISMDTNIDDIIKEIESSNIIPSQQRKNRILSKLANYKKFATKIPKGLDFKESVMGFFGGDYQFTIEEIAEGLLECRQYKSSNILAELKTGCIQLASSVNLTGDVGPNSNVARAIAALHVVCYQRKEGFPYIVYMSDKTKNMVALEFVDGVSASEDLLMVYDALTRLNATINLSVDSFMKSIGISID